MNRLLTVYLLLNTIFRQACNVSALLNAKSRTLFQTERLRATSDENSNVIYNEVFLKKKLTELGQSTITSPANSVPTAIPSVQQVLDNVEAANWSKAPVEGSRPINNGAATSVPTSQGRSVTAAATEELEKKLLPFFEISSIGATGRWVQKGGNFLLYPKDPNVPPNGVIHFLGGAFVGAAPHLTYRYLLEALNEGGFIIVATPFRLEMDYLKSCDAILSKFDEVAVDLAKEYGPLPVIGLGHSCGALLQTLITSLFPEAPRAINILISFNNLPASDAIPAFEELIIPLSEQIMADSERSSKFRESIKGLRTRADDLVDTFAKSQLAPLFLYKEVVPITRQAVEVLDQIPPLLKVIAQGQREFDPSPKDTREVCRRMYRARRTLLIKFETDDIDESEDIEKVLREANTIMRMKWPMREMDVQLRTLRGTHITPLTQNVLLEPPANLPLLLKPLADFNELLLSPVRSQYKENFLATINQVKDEILTFLDSSFKA